MEYVLATAVALFLGFNLAVLVARLLGTSEPGESAERVRAHGHVVSAWWR
jgi:hypothetical protein